MIPVSKSHLPVAAATHPGRRGKNNEDRYAVSAYVLTERQAVPAILAIVADGIGGHRAGEIAAEMAVENISRQIAASDASLPVSIFQDAITSTSHAIYAKAESDPELDGMGTTCACCWIIGDRLYTVAVGDSRIYLARGGAIQQLTTDHTWIQEAIDLRAITPEQARGHPNKHIIQRFLGSREPPQPDFRLRLSSAESDAQAEANQGLILEPGDQILLCTDGLTDLVNDSDILTVLQSKGGQPALERLIGHANQRGGHDNITLVLIQVPESAAPIPVQPHPRRKLVLTCLTISALAVVAAILLARYWIPDRDPNRQHGTGPPIATAVNTSARINQTITASPLFETTLPEASLTPVKTVEPGISATPSPTIRLFTLTPWPTNTP
jgi:serine/threonine protein phosphatase PrpC